MTESKQELKLPPQLNTKELAMCDQANSLGFKYFVVGSKKGKPIFANTEAECELDKKTLKADGQKIKVYIKKTAGWSEVI